MPLAAHSQGFWPRLSGSDSHHNQPWVQSLIIIVALFSFRLHPEAIHLPTIVDCRLVIHRDYSPFDLFLPPVGFPSRSIDKGFLRTSPPLEQRKARPPPLFLFLIHPLNFSLFHLVFTSGFPPPGLPQPPFHAYIPPLLPTPSTQHSQDGVRIQSRPHGQAWR